MVKLVLPIVIALFLALFFGIKSIYNSHKFSLILIKTTVMTFIILFLGTAWWWLTEPDGLGQVIQSIIYGICFVVIIIIDVIVLVIVKKKKLSSK